MANGPPQAPLRSPFLGSGGISQDWQIYFAQLNAFLALAETQNWTPALSAAGSMTVSSVTINGAYFLRQGPLVFFALEAQFTLGGSASNTVLISLPPGTMPPNAAWGFGASAQLLLPGASQFVVGVSWVDSASGIVVRQDGGANFPLGAYQITVTGTFNSIT